MNLRHPGFKNVAAGIAEREGVSEKRAGAMLATATRHAGPEAKRKNPALKKVKPVKGRGGLPDIEGGRP